ncbi:restriction endonuclease subunit S [Eubacterium sp. AF17-7]|uniref:restriction endonuclease subunit S n=1 Tax=Eubacterium sp. AF17-7 TaxID=2293105 RepID=UPI000E466E53|nr:restriction endonuclease subunit S [Eubacterium sp. AF17-7]RGG67174.1 restriction endonuclease subunit S [Eubacterium sp. AF17-7]
MIFIKLHHYILFFICNTWEQRKLGEICDSFEYGLNAAATDYDGENKYIRITDIDDNSHEFLQNNVTSPDIDFSGAENYKLKQGDILFARTGASVGKTYIYEESDGLVYYAGFLIRGRVKNEYSPEFVFQNTLTADYERFIRITSQRSGQPGVNAQEYASYQIATPVLEEQQQIGAYFSTLDHLITLHQRKYFIIYNKLITWEQCKFAAVFDGLPNNTFSRAELNYESGTVKNVHYGDVLIKFGDYINASETELPYISDDAKADKFKNSFLQDGDIIIADTAEDEAVGKCTEIQGSEGLKLLSGLHTIACRPKEKYGPMFLGYYINSPAYHNQLKPLMQGIKVTSISKSALQDTDMIMPQDIEEQEKIGEYFSNLDHLITLHRRAL